MTKTLIGLYLLLLTPLLATTEVIAQGGMARIQYEEAEVAFARGDFPAAVQGLIEAERLLGAPNASILRLRILARDQLIRQDRNYDFNTLQALRSDCREYTRSFGDANQWIDLTRELRPVCERLSALAATRQAREREIQEMRERAQAEQRMAEAERREQQRLAAVRAEEERRRTELREIDRQIASYEGMLEHEPFMSGAFLLMGAPLVWWGVSSWGGDDEAGVLDYLFSGGAVAVGGTVGLLGGLGLIKFKQQREHLRELQERRGTLVSASILVPDGLRGAGFAITISF
jgi:hypothetical protein